MFAATGNHVDALERVAIGQLVLDGLAAGEWRTLDAAQIARAFEPPTPAGR
jgi:16S rRNA pseudouridine516 synthase